MPTTSAPWLARLRRHVPAVLFLLAALFFLLRSHMYWAPRSVDVATLGLVGMDGAALPAAAVRGKPVVLNFWAPWCGPCRAELPRFEAMARDHPDVAFLGLDDDGPSDAAALDNARSAAAAAGVTFPLVLAGAQAHRVLGTVTVLPTTLYIAPSGRVVHTITGVVPESTMRRLLADILPPRH